VVNWLCFTENVKDREWDDFGGAEKMTKNDAASSLSGALGLILRKN